MCHFQVPRLSSYVGYSQDMDLPKKKPWKTILDSPVILCPAIAARLQ